MNAKHPIDELFAQGLRDARATPPTAVWEGIERERGWAHVTLLKLRRNWGYSTLTLILLLGMLGYWTYPEPMAQATARSAITPTEPAGTTLLVNDAELDNSVQPLKAKHASASPKTLAASDGSTHASGAGDRSMGSPENPTPHSSATTAQRLSVPTNNLGAPGRIEGSTTTMGDERSSTHSQASVTSRAVPSTKSDVSVILVENPKVPSASSGTSTLLENVRTNASGSDAGTQSTSAVVVGRSSQDLFASRTDVIGTRLIPGTLASATLIPGRMEVPLVIRHGHTWVALLAEWADVHGEWSGRSNDMSELNKSETWRDRSGVGIALGREWHSGISLGLGISATRVRSRFFHEETRPGSTQTVVDTSWSSVANGSHTVSTWNINSTTIEAPGIEQVYSASNTYTLLRVTPELSYRKHLGRWSIALHAGPVMTFTLARRGNTLADDAIFSLMDSSMVNRNVRLLADPGLNDRFALSIGASAGLDVRYRLSERISIGAGPSYYATLGRRSGPAPELGTREIGGRLLLIYDLPQRERRIK